MKKINKILVSLGVVLIVLVPVSIVMSYKYKKNTSIKNIIQKTQSESWISNQSYQSYFFENALGETLNIPMFDNNFYNIMKNSSNLLSDETKTWTIKYNEITKDIKDEKKVDKKMKEKFLEINKDAKNFINKRPDKKYIGFYQNKNKTELIFTLKELKKEKQSNAQDFLDKLHSSADVDNQNNIKNNNGNIGHLIWRAHTLWDDKNKITWKELQNNINKKPNEKIEEYKKRIIEFIYKNIITSEIKLKKYKKILHTFISNTNSVQEIKQKIIDYIERDDVKKVLNFQKPTKLLIYNNIRTTNNRIMNEETMNNLAKDKNINIIGYPFVDHEEEMGKLMLICSDGGFVIDEGIGKPFFKDAKHITYKVINLKNALPIIDDRENINQPELSKKNKEYLISILKNSIYWIAHYGGANIFKQAETITKDALPQVSPFLYSIKPFFNEFKKQNQIYIQKEKILNPEFEDHEFNRPEHYKKLTWYNNITKNIDEIAKIFQKNGINTSKLKEISKDINTNYIKWNLAWIKKNKHQYKLTRLLWIIRILAKYYA